MTRTQKDRQMTNKQTPMADIASLEVAEANRAVFTHKVTITLLDGQIYSCECDTDNEAIETAKTLSEILADFTKEEIE